MDIRSWLRGLGLQQYEQAFRDGDIDSQVLPDLTAEDLVELGVRSIGHRRKLLAAIMQLKTGAAPMPTEPTPAVPADSRTLAERRQLSIMFCDLVGSTPFSTRLDPEDWRVVLGAYHAAVTEAVRRVEGHVAQYLGDGVLAYFGYPQAHEDDAERVLRAGLDVVGRVARLDGAGEKLAARVGIATGLVVVGDLIGTGDAQEPGVVGETPNLAARLQTMAEPGTVVLDEPTRRLAGDLFEWRALGTQAVRGFDRPIQVWQALRESSVESRFEALRAASLTPLAGRSEEIELLARRWQRARDGEGQVVLLSGEPGIGKSRLAEELQAHLRDEPHTRLRWFCSPHHRDSPLQPFIAQLERAAGFAREDSESARLDKLEALIVTSDSTTAADTAPLADLLGLAAGPRYAPLPQDPQRKRELVLQALLQQLEQLANRKPVLMLFEDAHWADSTSLELLDRVVHCVAHLPVLAVISFRPEFQPPWLGQSHVQSLSLSRLSQDETAAMVSGVTAGKSLPPELLAHIVDRTDGIPLFVEELTKSLVEGGQLRETDQGFVLDGPLPTLAVPSSLQASLLARLDRLAPVRDVAQIGAAIGREFAYELVSGVAHRSDTDLQGALDRLVEAGLVFCRGMPPHATYLFKHTLVQDTVYGTLLREQRQALHARIGQALERTFPETARLRPEVLAYHFTQAGMAERAVEYWQQSGQQALGRSANLEAVQHLSKGLEILKMLPEAPARAQRELLLQSTLGPALMAARGYGASEVEAVYNRALALCRNVGETPQLFGTLMGLWQFYLFRAQHQTARELAERLLSLAKATNDPALLIQAHRALGETFQNLGELVLAQKHLAQGSALNETLQHRSSAILNDPGAFCLSFESWVLWLLGFPERALMRSQAALALARRLSQPHTLAALRFFAAMLHQFRREFHLTQQEAEAVIVLAHEEELPFWVPYANIVQGWALAMQGQGEAGIAQIQRGLADQDDLDTAVARPVYLAMLAEAHAAAGQIERGLGVLAEALSNVERTEERYYEAELHRLKGELLLRQAVTDSRQAEACFRHALAVAQRQQATSWELRTATSLCRLWQQQGKRAEAHEVLAPIYGRFTEGFETDDLQVAKVLLERLI